MGVIHIENDLNCIWISNPIATDKSIQGMGHELALSEVTGELMERNRSRSVINNIDNQWMATKASHAIGRSYYLSVGRSLVKQYPLFATPVAQPSGVL